MSKHTLALTNWEKALVLRLLENERFSKMQHAKKVKDHDGHDLTSWATTEAKFINGIISKLELNERDENEDFES